MGRIKRWRKRQRVIERGIEAIHGVGEGMVVIADDDELEWPKIVLGNVQAFAAARGFYVSRMQRKLHSYHLDDAPDLKSCNLFVSSLPSNQIANKVSKPIDFRAGCQIFMADIRRRA